MTDEQIIKHFRDTWKMDIVENGNGYIANGFHIRAESISNASWKVPLSTGREWSVHASLGGRMEPDTLGYEEVSREKNLAMAFAKVERMAKWKSEERCVECDEKMSDSDIWMNKGVCPYCAYKPFHYQSFAETRVVRFKVIQSGMKLGPIPPKWKFWAKQKEVPVYKKVLHTDDIKREKSDG